MMDSDHCMHFVERKKRFCRMTVQKGHQYCGEHQRNTAGSDTGNERVPCPLDPTHTCYRSKLTKHLGVCNVKRRLDAQPTFVVEGTNLDDETIATPPRVPLSQLDESVIRMVIRKIHAAYDELPEFSQTILRHNVLEDKLNDETSGNKVRKHLLQNASLLGHLEQAGLMQDDTCFIEFGAGKAQLTYWLGQIIKDKSNSCILLVDRSSHRHKSDNKLKIEESRLTVKRIRADIADLQLNQISEIQPIKYKIGIAKHLCGTATDLAIRCLIKSMNSEPKVDVRGLIVAFCCHHKCEYSSYVGRKYLQQCGFTADEFPVLCSIVSWATCGCRLKSDVNSPSDATSDAASGISSKSDEREVIGRKAKILLNWGRLIFLKSVGFQAELLYYISTDVSLENMCIVATREHSS
ncbi:tRNA guanosine-2'-O-methyltransferase TRM13 like protein [Trachymyrmex septentrionalis]|uniref:tRNA:m(4)X modification enzyme TRM13 n=1 Tax=Trachymyrmex septentrionalis TaxID=34720 RepID=A0A195FM28_9HYME|nr:PREDICTED: tRNA:m(4)X modification enzyme TRM13 homolog [Trachymyrmex septentrionalis]KYN41039.1 tRNA guanosine-2'-O-methyltransferase TRM13 like protein [Trachymyrmex septentrionalis]